MNLQDIKKHLVITDNSGNVIAIVDAGKKKIEARILLALKQHYDNGGVKIQSKIEFNEKLYQFTFEIDVYDDRGDVDFDEIIWLIPAELY